MDQRTARSDVFAITANGLWFDRYLVESADTQILQPFKTWVSQLYKKVPVIRPFLVDRSGIDATVPTASLLLQQAVTTLVSRILIVVLQTRLQI